MRVRTVSVLLLVMALYFIITVAAQVFVDDYVKPRSLFTYLLISTIVTGVASLAINIEIPD
jgi:hypothetical protein